ncbi:hypothetical protein MKK42_18050 [Escherichia coli]|uniref:hypothetical protein n=1 Tax=Escherichia coli TaxID=562 RepID=UPI001F5943E8|nr:hypothetical protein [Escherichia coli]MCI2233998.1 hypothetical protein [Escherichia coli]
MKLIDLLVRELPKHGGWPDGAVECQRFVDEANIDFYDENGNWDDDCLLTYGAIAAELVRKQVVSCEHEQVTFDEYQSALAESQKVEWIDGLPPVGCECEARYREADGAEWFFFRCIAVDCGVAFGWAGKDAATLGKGGYEFRPIRSEADKKRDDAIEKITDAICGEIPDTGMATAANYAARAYDSIAAGKIPGVKLED